MKFFTSLTLAIIALSLVAGHENSTVYDHQLIHNQMYKGQAPMYNHGITLECDFGIIRHYWGEMYTCIARNLVTRHYYDYVVNATGDHMTGKSDKDVQAIYILGQHTPFIPYNLTMPFGGSVVALRVEKSGLTYVNRTFSYEGKLEYIHFENNFIREVPTWIFHNMTASIKWLSLRNNRISYLEGTLLHGMTNLKRFSVSKNRIHVVPSGLFHDTPALEEIYFYNNRIRMVGWKLVSYTRGLKVAAFAGNPCTEISIYDGVNVVDRLTTEFKTKCSVNCNHAETAIEDQKNYLNDELKAAKDCADEYKNKQQQQRRNPYGPNQIRSDKDNQSASSEN